MQARPLDAQVRAGSGRQIRANASLRSWMEACVFLVGAPVFNTGERRYPSLAGSIPVRLRHVTFAALEPRLCTTAACRHRTLTASEP
jgi:hypothetical protein